MQVSITHRITSQDSTKIMDKTSFKYTTCAVPELPSHNTRLYFLLKIYYFIDSIRRKAHLLELRSVIMMEAIISLYLILKQKTTDAKHKKAEA